MSRISDSETVPMRTVAESARRKILESYLSCEDELSTSSKTQTTRRIEELDAISDFSDGETPHVYEDFDEDPPTADSDANLITTIFSQCDLANLNQVDGIDQFEANQPPEQTLEQKYVEMVMSYLPFYEVTSSKVMMMKDVRLALNNMRNLSPALQGQMVSIALASKGYPTYITGPFVRAIANGFPTKRLEELNQMHHGTHRSTYEVDRQQTRKTHDRVFASTDLRKGNKRTAKSWRVPYKPIVGDHPKPHAKNFTISRYRQWVSCVATALSMHINSKTQFISGNSAAETLWYMTKYAGRKKDFGDLLAQAYIFIEDYKFEERKPGPSRPLLTKGLFVHGRFIEHPAEFSGLEHLFREDKPLFRHSVAYLEQVVKKQPITWDAQRLQRTLDKRINRGPEITLARADSDVSIHFSKPGETHQTTSYQGNGLSAFAPTPIIVRHEAADNVTTALRAVAGDLAVSTLEKIARPTIQILSFINALRMSTSLSHLMNSILQFVSGNETAWNFVQSLLKKIDLAQHQADGVFYYMTATVAEFVSVKLFIPLWEAIVGAGLFTLISSTMGAVTEHIFEPLKELISNVRVSMMRVSGKQIAETIIEGILSILHTLQRCYHERSLAPLWGERWDPKRWDTYVQNYMGYYTTLTVQKEVSVKAIELINDLRESKLLPDFWIEPVSLGYFVEYCDRLWEQGDKIRNYYAKDVQVYAQMTRTMMKFRDFFNPLRFKAAGVPLRIQPFLLYWCGIPGGGKSNLSREVFTAMCHKNGWNETNYDWRPNVNFQSGLDHGFVGIDMDDVDQSVAPPTAGFPNHIENLIAAVNNNPFPIEEAVADIKGKTFACPLVVNYKSNYHDAKVTECTKAPDAFWRRIGIHIEVSAKGEFGIEGTLDPDLADMSDTWDMYVFKVSFWDPRKNCKQNPKNVCLTEPVTMDFKKLIETIHARFEKHLTRERNRLSKFSYGGTRCPVCKMPAHKKCGHDYEYQGQVWSTARAVARPLVDYMAGHVLSNAVERMFGDNFWLGAGSTLVVAGALATLIERASSYQGRVANAVEGFLPFNWFRADQNYTPGVPPLAFTSVPYTKDDLLAAVKSSFVKVKGPRYDAYGVMLSHNLVLYPTHLCPKYDDTLQVTIDDVVITVVLTAFNFRVTSNPELAVVKVGQMKGTGGISRYMWKCVDEQLSVFDAVEVILPTKTYISQNNKVEPMNGQKVLRVKAPTVSGDCGGLYIARVGETAWRIVGMHFMGTSEGTILYQTPTYGYGAFVTSLDCERVATQLASTLQGVSTQMSLLSKTPQNVEFLKYPAKSEVWAAVSVHGAEVYPMGMLDPPMSGSTMKTRLAHSTISDLCAGLAEAWCGRPDYWQLPDFRGKMVDGKWTSPFTESFKTQNKGVLKHEVMWMAVADYLSGVRGLNVEGFAELSEEQAISGVPGSYVHRVNMKTSSGPPFNVNKHAHFAITDDGSYLSENMWRLFDDLQRVLEDGSIPAAVVLCTLKDEALSPGKSPRVFSVLSAAYNLLLKKKFSAFEAFMRTNKAVFESAVGVNMTGTDVNEIVAALRAIDPELANLFDRDAKRLDKSFSGDLWDFAALVVYGLCFAIGVDPIGCFTLALGIKHSRYSIKNDIFSVFWNPSGQWSTTSINGIVMSNGERYVYYSDKVLPTELLIHYMENFFAAPIPGAELTFYLDFRKYYSLWTFGDDCIFATKYMLNPRYEEIWLDEIGIQVTDASKIGRMRPKTIKDVQFLKRTFVWSDEFQMYIAPLDKKSMARMLMIKKDSTLSSIDHAATALTECLREAVYHGRAFYEELLVTFTDIAEKKGLMLSGYLHLLPYDHYAEKVRKGTFQTWIDRSTLLADNPLLQDEQHFDGESGQ
jgi:hypothetical protein